MSSKSFTARPWKPHPQTPAVSAAGEYPEMEARERIQLRKILRVVGGATLILLAAALYFGAATSKQMKRIVRGQFNEQQLVLAKNAVSRIEATIQNAISDLVLLNSLPSIQYCDADSYETLLLATLPVLNRDCIIEIRRVDRDGTTLLVANDQGVGLRHIGPNQNDAGAYLSWASAVGNRGKTMAMAIRPKDPTKEKRRMVMDLVTPSYEDSADNRNPRPSHRFSGYLRVTVDVSMLLEQSVSSIRSGKSGYAWVLDSSGAFLYHPEAAFVGENAFEARSNRNPAISFDRINQIQREEMLQGKEGTGTYVSGWHREVVEPMEKLIAYSPVRVQGPYEDYVWSVAVAAPSDEIEGIIGLVYARQMLLQGLIVFVILLGGGIVLLHELRWSTILEHEVAVKTEHLRHYAAQLEQSESRYRSLVESAEDLIFTLSKDGVIKTVNQYMCELFGADRDALVEKNLHAFLPKEQAESQLELVRNVHRTGKGRRMETPVRVQSQDYWFNIQYIPVRGGEGEQELILGIGRDITERKSLEKQFLHTEKLASLGTLAAGVAHEINNPLGIMLGFCDLLLERIEPGTMEYNDLKTIERHGLHCKSIVERLLSFARITEETEKSCDINENVETILSVVEHTLKMNGIKLVSRLTPDLPMIQCDSRGLQQVLLNLINNAVYAMGTEGTLTVQTLPGKGNRWVELVIADTGCGISEEFREKVFDPFFTTKKFGDGTGLGLSVSYGIVSKYGGSIDCESFTKEEMPGQSGTTFSIILLAAPPDAREPAVGGS